MRRNNVARCITKNCLDGMTKKAPMNQHQGLQLDDVNQLIRRELVAVTGYPHHALVYSTRQVHAQNLVDHRKASIGHDV